MQEPKEHFPALNMNERVTFVKYERWKSEEIGIEVTCVELPAKRLFTYLSEGKIDCFVGIKTHPMLTKSVLTTTELTGTIDMNLYYLKKADKAGYKTINDVKNIRIGTMGGYSYGWSKM